MKKKTENPPGLEFGGDVEDLDLMRRWEEEDSKDLDLIRRWDEEDV